MSLVATDCLIAPHNGNSWPMTPSCVWPTTGYHSLSQASTHFQLITRLLQYMFQFVWYSPHMDPVENMLHVACVSVVAVTWFGCCGNVFTEALPSNGHLLWSFGFQQICHNIYLKHFEMFYLSEFSYIYILIKLVVFYVFSLDVIQYLHSNLIIHLLNSINIWCTDIIFSSTSVVSKMLYLLWWNQHYWSQTVPFMNNVNRARRTLDNILIQYK
jgi:hypothetical protein